MVSLSYSLLLSPSVRKRFPVKNVPTVSTIGAGDNFNAGILYGLVKYDIRRDDLDTLSEETWTKVVQCGIDFATEVCQSFDNSISKEFAERYKNEE